MYTLKSIVQRGTLFGASAALLAATVVPSAMVFADALNPLTERSLLLTSSAPGFQNSDGSGNTAANPNTANGGEYYSPPGSGPNGKQTGETFKFRVSTDSAANNRAIKALTFQYCVEAAGLCQAPGNNPLAGGTGPLRGADTATTSDLNINYASPVAGTDFQVFVDNVDVSTGWTMVAKNVEDAAHSGPETGKNNFITLERSDDTVKPAFNAPIRIVFKASDTNYITNPGEGSFFVKINTYDTDDDSKHIPAASGVDNPNIIDGGVTVANVMTDSIHITTKVLETMSFSVGTKNEETSVIDCPVDPQNPECKGAGAVHGTCAPIQVINGNRLQLGNPDAEYSLETDTAWDVYSYWRLSSNSSGGATVYYSGNTLANTVGDSIAPIGAAPALSTPGTEQFGLGFVDATTDDTGKFDPAFVSLTGSEPARFKMPTLRVLAKESAYANGAGTINGASKTAQFAFKKESNTVPEVIAQNSSSVISCDTAKMRYVANIGADTPAGVYTTKINYLAAPQY